MNNSSTSGGGGGGDARHLERYGDVVVDRRRLTRVMAVNNGKGGVGKTSYSTHCCGLAAAAGYRALLVDLDVQGNAADDLGFTDRTDNGAAMLTALITGQAPQVLKDVRPGLDVVCGGSMLAGVEGVLAGVSEQQRNSLAGQMRIAQVLQHVAPLYDLVVIDCPPNRRGVAVFSAAQFVLAPTKSDASSLHGLTLLAGDFVEARKVNPGIELLGVVLFGSTPRGTQIAAEASAAIEEILEGAAPLMGTSIRHVEAVAKKIRDQGRLAYELEAMAVDVAMLRGGKPRGASSTSSLAGDYQALVGEVLARFNERVRVLEAAA
jgi:chromosome partitioning protein